MKKIKFLILSIVFGMEIWTLCYFQDPIVNAISFLGQSVNNNFDDIMVGIIGALILSGLQMLNDFLVNVLLGFSNESFRKLLQIVFKCTSRHLEEVRNKMITFLFSCEPKWGVHQRSDVYKNANSAEGILACVYAVKSGNRLTQSQESQLRETLTRMVNELDEKGLKSFNEEKYSVPCTAMGAYAIKKAVDSNLFELSYSQEDRIRKCMRLLLENANQCGWGFENKHYDDLFYNRSLSTLWALRALHVWDFGATPRYQEIVENFVGQTEGLIGFAPDTVEKSSCAALLYTLINEVEGDSGKRIFHRVNMDKLRNHLLRNINIEIESEEYIVDKQIVRKLPWTHFSECLIYEALSYAINDLKPKEYMWFYFHLGKALKKIDATKYYYSVASMNFNHNNPFFYPTAYMIIAVSSIIHRTHPR